MSTKKVIASFVVELTENESGSQSITVTRRGPLEDSFALLATETSLDISATIQRLSKELQRISENHLLYRC